MGCKYYWSNKYLLIGQIKYIVRNNMRQNGIGCLAITYMLLACAIGGEMRMIIILILLGLLLPSSVIAEETKRIILGRVENVSGEAWTIEEGNLEPAWKNKRVVTDSRLKVKGTVKIFFLNGNQLELYPGSVVEFTPKGFTFMIKGQGRFSLINGREFSLNKEDQSFFSFWASNMRPRLEGDCEVIMLKEWLKHFVLSMGLDLDLPSNFLSLQECEVCELLNNSLRKNDMSAFPCEDASECLKREFYVDYYYDFLAKKLQWPETTVRRKKEKALERQGYLNPIWAENDCVCRAEAIGMIWDLFLRRSLMASSIDKGIFDPYEVPFPNLYETPVSRK